MKYLIDLVVSDIEEVYDDHCDFEDDELHERVEFWRQAGVFLNYDFQPHIDECAKKHGELFESDDDS